MVFYIPGFRGLGQDNFEYINISEFDPYMRNTLLEAIGRAGFASKTDGEDILLPCPLGTFVNPSVSNPNELECIDCPAGKLLFVSHEFITLLRLRTKHVERT